MLHVSYIYLQMPKSLHKWNHNQVICSGYFQKLSYFSFTGKLNQIKKLGSQFKSIHFFFISYTELYISTCSYTRRYPVS